MSAPETVRPAPPRWLGIAAAGVALLTLSWLGADYLMQPRRATGFLLGALGDRLGLEIRAGDATYRLRGTPMLDLRGLEVRRPGDPVALLRADRAYLSLPWSTLRGRGDRLDIHRVELDAPVLDLPALRRWLGTRPEGEGRIATLRDGLSVTDGRIDNDGWRIVGLAIDVPTLHPERLLRARVRGRYLDPPISIPVDLSIAVAHPRRALSGVPTGIAGAGTMVVAGDGWQVPAQVLLSGPLRLGRNSALLQPASFGMAARYRSRSTDAPFRLGLHGPMAFRNASWRLVPVHAVLDGDGPVPDAVARGSATLGRRMALRLRGQIAAWPRDWPQLPEPLAASGSPLPFALRYVGGLDFAALAALELRRDDARFDARFHLPQVLDWTDAASTGSPLPPLQGSLRAPRLQIAGATLQDVVVEFDDPAVAPVSP